MKQLFSQHCSDLATLITIGPPRNDGNFLRYGTEFTCNTKIYMQRRYKLEPSLYDWANKTPHLAGVPTV